MAVSGKEVSPPDQPLAQFRNLYRNYRLFNEFLNLPEYTINQPLSTDTLATFNGPTFIADLFTLKAAYTDLQEKNIEALQNSLVSFNPNHPYIKEKRRKLYLRYLFIQKKYQQFIDLCKTHPQISLETQLCLLYSLYKTGKTEATQTVLSELFPTQPILTLEKYIARAPLNNFLKQVEPETWFKKLHFLARNNRYEAFLYEKKYANVPQTVALFQAELDYNSKNYDKSEKALTSVTDEALLPYKKYLLLKLQLRDSQYSTLFATLAELENEPTLYPIALLDCANILMLDGETDLAIQVFSRYTMSYQAMVYVFNTVVHANISIQHDHYWKSLWLCAWLCYQKNDKAAAITYFKEGINAPDDTFRIANRYWLQRLAPTEIASIESALSEFPFSYYYTRVSPGSASLTQSVQVFADLLNFPRSEPLNQLISLLKTMVHYNLHADACDFIQWTLHNDTDTTLSNTDKDVLKILQAILYIKQGKENMAYNRFKQNFPNYTRFLLPRFLRQIIMPLKYQDIVEKYSAEQNIESELLYSLIREESFFRADVVSYAKAYGLMQLLLPTARQMAAPYNITLVENDLTNPELNIRFGTQYLRQLLDKYNGKVHLALAAYNAGDFRVDKWLERFGQAADDEFIEMIPFTATRTYVKNILRNYYFYRYYYGKNKD